MSDFEFVSRYTIYNFDFTVVNDGVIADPDDNEVEATLYTYTGTQVLQRDATRVSEGVYRLTLSSAETATPGLFYIIWDYELATIDQRWRTDLEVSTSTTPLYVSLGDDARAVVDGVWGKFSDLFDSRLGGPHLQEYAQSSFGRESIAKLASTALGRLNAASQPHQTFTLDSFQYNDWSGIFEQATYIEVIKHLMRSYVEQPEAVGVDLARLDRRDYLQRWQTILQTELDEFGPALSVYKMAAMNLGRAVVLVGGGRFGGYTNNRPLGQPRRPPAW